jgi:hypothetical protein
MTPAQEKKLEKNSRDLMRELLGGLKLSDIRPLHDLEKVDIESHKKLCQFCFQMVSNPFFQMIGKDLTLQTLQHVAVGTKDFQEDLFNRATINGIQLVGETLEKYAKEWQTKYMPREQEFDPHRSFEPTKTFNQ